MTDLLLPGPTKGECACECGLFGTLRKKPEGHVRGCECPRCRGGRNRAKGDAKARKARKLLNLVGANTRHEELHGGPLRYESKAGAQVGPIATRFLAAEAQSEAARPMGDNRPFVMTAMPDGWKNGLLITRLDVFDEVAFAHVAASPLVIEFATSILEGMQ